jgi:hypothetical protein
MPKKKTGMKVCLDCRRHPDAVGPLSNSGLCSQCSKKRMEKNWERIRLISARLKERWEAEEQGGVRLEDAMRELETKWNQ